MRNFWKIFIVCLLLGLLIWLIFDPQGEQSRFKGLQQAFRNGHIGKLTPSEEKSFEQEVRQLCQTAGVKQAVVINQLTGDSKTFRSKLHFFITNGAEKYTH